MAFVASLLVSVAAGQDTAFSLIAEQNSAGSATRLPDGGVVFAGEQSLAVTGWPSVSQTAFSVALVARLRAGTGGYLFAMADATDGSRYVSLYFSPSRGALVAYYRSGGTSQQHQASFPAAALSDGAAHRVLLTVRGAEAAVAIDGAEPQRVSLVGLVDTCDATAQQQCRLDVGQRAAAGGGGAFRMTGTSNP